MGLAALPGHIVNLLTTRCDRECVREPVPGYRGGLLKVSASRDRGVSYMDLQLVAIAAI